MSHIHFIRPTRTSQTPPGIPLHHSLGRYRRLYRRIAWFLLAVGVLIGFLSIESAFGQNLTTFNGLTAVGATVAQTVTVTAQAVGTVNAVEVLTQGQSGLDYTASGQNTCAAANLNIGSTCQVAVNFTPRHPGARNGAIVLLDSSNNVLATQYLSGTGQGALGVMVPGTIETVAGSAEWILPQDGSPATQAGLFLPSSVAVDGVGNLYIADSVHNSIREVYATGPNKGIIETICNVSGVGSYTGDGSSAVNATLNVPGGVAIDGAGNLYIADTENNAIREINAATGNISTIAGTGVPGYNGNGAALTHQLNTPDGVTVDAAGNVYIADTYNQRVREYSPLTQSITTIAGNGVIDANGNGSFSGDNGPALQAGLNKPYAVAFDAAGNMYIPDSANNRVRVVYAGGPHAGNISTFAGNGSLPGFSGDGGPAVAASLNAPSGLAVDPAGNIYISDTQNNRVRKVNITSGGNLINTIAGSGAQGFGGDGAGASLASLDGPQGLFLDSLGNLYIADYFNQRIREIQSDTVVLTFTPAIRDDQVSAPQVQTIENDGNASLTFSSIVPDSNAAIQTSSTTCTLATTLSIDATCNVGAEFAPTEVGNPVIGNIDLIGNASNSPLNIQVVDQALALTSTTTTLTGAPSPTTYSTQVVLTATVSTGTGMLSGDVTFKEGTTILGTAPLIVANTNITGTATFTTSAFAVGQHSLNAVYDGDGVHGTSTSHTFTEDIQQPTTTIVSSSENPSVSGDSVTFTATVTPAPDGGAAPTGTVTFYDNTTTVLGSATLSGSTAALTISTLSVGSHSITAAYTADSQNAASSSTAVTQVVKAITTVVVAGVANPAALGASVRFTATVHGNGATPTGLVTFTSGGAPLGSSTLSGSGSTATASVSTATLSVGTHLIIATYAGDSNNAGSANTAYTETISAAASTTALSSTPNPSASGQNVTFSVFVTGGSTAVSGSVALKDGSSTIATTPVGAGGAATFTVSSLAVGTHTITAVYGGDSNYSTSTSPSLTQKVLPNTAAVLSSSRNPSIAGLPVTVTVTVTGAGASPTGSVTLLDGSATLASLTLNGSGVATCTTSALTAGSHSLTAVYAGDANNAGATSSALIQVVNDAATSTAVSAAANPAIAGKSLSLAATVTGNGVTPTGAVKFYSGATLLGSSTLNGSGVATLATSTLAVGSDSITAVYMGDANNNGSTSAAYALSLVQATTTVNLASTPNPAVALDTVTFTVTVTGNGGIPTGNVVFSDGATPLATVPLNVNGGATYATSALAVGQHTIAAAYQGDANDLGSTANVTQIIQQAVTTIAVSSSLNPSTVGASVTFTAVTHGTVGAPSGTVLFQDAGATIGTANLGGHSSATFTTTALPMAQHAITVSYSGDANNASAASTPLTQTVQETTGTVLTANKNPSIGGTPVIFTATVTGANGGPVTGTVTFKSGATTLGTGTITAGVATFTVASLPVGTNSTTAVYGGDTLNAGSTSTTFTQTVQSATTATALASSENPSFVGDNVTFTATVTGNGVTPTGTVTFKDGATAAGSTNLNASGVATYATSALAVGSHPITAIYNADQYDSASTSRVVNQAVQAHTNLVLTSSSNPALAVTQVTFNITATDGTGVPPIGSVTLLDGTATLAQLPLSSAGTATYSTSTLTVGQHPITAVYAGDAIDVAGTSSLLTETIQAIPTKTTLGASSTSLTTAQQLTLVASVFSADSVPLTGTVSFQNGTTVVGSTAITAAGTATITPSLAAGNYSLVAVYSGDANNAISTSVPVTVTVTQATGFDMSLNPSTVTIPTTQHSIVTLTLTSDHGFSDQLGLGCGSLPASVTCNFSQPMVSLNANGTETVQLTIDTASPLASGGTAKNEAPGAPSSTTMLAWLFPGSALFGFFWWRSRRKLNGLLSLLLLVILGGAMVGLSGCGGLSDSSAKPGTYTIQVTADGVKTGMTNAVAITVTVSQ